MVEVRPLARKGACPRSHHSPRRPLGMGLGLKVEEGVGLLPCPTMGWVVVLLQVRRERLRGIGNWPYRTGRVQILRPALPGIKGFHSHHPPQIDKLQVQKCISPAGHPPPTLPKTHTVTLAWPSAPRRSRVPIRHLEPGFPWWATKGASRAEKEPDRPGTGSAGAFSRFLPLW